MVVQSQTTALAFLYPRLSESDKAFSAIRSTGNPYLTLSFIAKEFFMAQLVV